MQQLDTFTRAYIECALWSSLDESDPNTGGYPLDRNYDITDIHPDTLAEMAEDCRLFQEGREDLFAGREERAGQDFWLTRNRHGAGFWDGDWPEPAATELTEDAHAWGAVYLYVGEDGMIHG